MDNDQTDPAAADAAFLAALHGWYTAAHGGLPRTVTAYPLGTMVQLVADEAWQFEGTEPEPHALRTALNDWYEAIIGYRPDADAAPFGEFETLPALLQLCSDIVIEREGAP